MVQVNNLENCQVSENTSKSLRDNCNIDYRDLMNGQSFNNFSKCNDRNAMVAGCLPAMEIVDSSRRYSSDTQEAARLSKVLHSGSLLQELDSAKTGKLDGKISKNDLDIYLRMHPENTAQTRAVREIREAWDNRNHPNHGAVELLKKELAHERKDHNHDKTNFQNKPAYELPQVRPSIGHHPSVLRDAAPIEGHRPEGPIGRTANGREQTPSKAEAPKDIKEAGQVRPGEGYYQVAMRMIETTGHKPSHKETMELVQALRTANDNKTVLTVRDNLSTLLDKQLPGNQGKVKDHIRKSH
jgi:hypothetical protein